MEDPGMLGARPSIGGLLVALPTLAVTAFVIRELFGLRDSPSAPAMLARALRVCWSGLRACWRWSLSRSVAFWLAAQEIFSASADSPARRPPRS